MATHNILFCRFVISYVFVNFHYKSVVFLTLYFVFCNLPHDVTDLTRVTEDLMIISHFMLQTCNDLSTTEDVHVSRGTYFKIKSFM